MREVAIVLLAIGIMVLYWYATEAEYQRGHYDGVEDAGLLIACLLTLNGVRLEGDRLVEHRYSAEECRQARELLESVEGE